MICFLIPDNVDVFDFKKSSVAFWILFKSSGLASFGIFILDAFDHAPSVSLSNLLESFFYVLVSRPKFFLNSC